MLSTLALSIGNARDLNWMSWQQIILIFVQGLMAEKDLEIRSHILLKLKVDLKYDAVKIQERDVF